MDEFKKEYCVDCNTQSSLAVKVIYNRLKEYELKYVCQSCLVKAINKQNKNKSKKKIKLLDFLKDIGVKIDEV